MNLKRFLSLSCVLALFFAMAPRSAEAQLGRLGDAAKRAAERELEHKVTTVVGDAVACAVGNRECVEEAKKNGEPVVIVDEDGNVIADENGQPITDQDAAEAAQEKPGEGRWANYDYIPGKNVVFTSEWNIIDEENAPALKPNPAFRVGRIPGNIEFGEGSYQLVQIDGLNTLEFRSDSWFRISLSEPLPEDFSLEMTVQSAAPNVAISVYSEPYMGQDYGYQTYEQHYLRLWRLAGIYYQGDQVSGTDGAWSIAEELTPVKFQVDDQYAVFYLGSGGERIAQIPNFKHAVGSNALEIYVAANDQRPAYIRDITLAYGIDDPYDAIVADGAFTTRGILFDFDSDRLRPESTPVLEQIRGMLEAHADLETVVIEGHTDGIGSEDYNLELSQRRADAVKAYLVEEGIDGSRIQTAGKGESEPVADNATEAGRAENRRVVVKRPER